MLPPAAAMRALALERSLMTGDLEMRSDKKTMLEAISLMPSTIRFATLDLRDDEDVVLPAVAQDGDLLVYASQRLRNDKAVVLTALKAPQGNPLSVLQVAHPFFYSDREIMMVAVEKHGEVLWLASQALKADKEIAMVAIQTHPEIFELIDESLRKDRELALAAVGGFGDLLYAPNMPEEFKSDKTFQIASARAPRLRPFTGPLDALAASCSSIAHEGEKAPVVMIEDVERDSGSVYVRTAAGTSILLSQCLTLNDVAADASRELGVRRVHVVLQNGSTTASPWDATAAL